VLVALAFIALNPKTGQKKANDINEMVILHYRKNSYFEKGRWRRFLSRSKGLQPIIDCAQKIQSSIFLNAKSAQFTNAQVPFCENTNRITSSDHVYQKYSGIDLCSLDSPWEHESVRVELGGLGFFDPQFSTGTIACIECCPGPTHAEEQDARSFLDKAEQAEEPDAGPLPDKAEQAEEKDAGPLPDKVRQTEEPDASPLPDKTERHKLPLRARLKLILADLQAKKGV